MGKLRFYNPTNFDCIEAQFLLNRLTYDFVVNCNSQFERDLEQIEAVFII